MSASPTPASPRRARTIYLMIWAAMALPLPIDLWRGYLLRPGDDGLRQSMNVDLGLWAIRLFLLSLAITPAAKLLRAPIIARYRRLVGLFAFTYAMIHSVDYIVYAHAWAFPLRAWERRGYIVIGIAASLAMIPLAITSFDGLRRAMGPKAWSGLHALVYAIALLVIVHTLWEFLSNWIEPALYCAVLVVLLLIRLPPVMAALMRLQLPRAAKVVTGKISRLAS